MPVDLPGGALVGSHPRNQRRKIQRFLDVLFTSKVRESVEIRGDKLTVAGRFLKLKGSAFVRGRVLR
jgi:hypothetical protein